jgi:hypothetical protein
VAKRRRRTLRSSSGVWQSWPGRVERSSLRVAVILPRTEAIKQVRVAPKGVGHARENVELGTGSCRWKAMRGGRGGRSRNVGLRARHVSYETFWRKTSPLVSECVVRELESLNEGGSPL